MSAIYNFTSKAFAALDRDLMVATIHFDSNHIENLIVTEAQDGVIVGLPSAWSAETSQDPIGDTVDRMVQMRASARGSVLRAVSAESIRMIEIAYIPAARIECEFLAQIINSIRGNAELVAHLDECAYGRNAAA